MFIGRLYGESSFSMHLEKEQHPRPSTDTSLFVESGRPARKEVREWLSRAMLEYMSEYVRVRQRHTRIIGRRRRRRRPAGVLTNIGCTSG
jgi:hypothetical protein